MANPSSSPSGPQSGGWIKCSKCNHSENAPALFCLKCDKSHKDWTPDIESMHSRGRAALFQSRATLKAQEEQREKALKDRMERERRLLEQYEATNQAEKAHKAVLASHNSAELAKLRKDPAQQKRAQEIASGLMDEMADIVSKLENDRSRAIELESAAGLKEVQLMSLRAANAVAASQAEDMKEEVARLRAVFCDAMAPAAPAGGVAGVSPDVAALCAAAHANAHARQMPPMGMMPMQMGMQPMMPMQMGMQPMMMPMMGMPQQHQFAGGVPPPAGPMGVGGVPAHPLPRFS